MKARYLIVIPAGDKLAVNTVAQAQWDPKKGERTFPIGLSATGKIPVTHLWCSSVFEEEKEQSVSTLPIQFLNAKVHAYDANKDTQFPGRLLATLGLKQIENFPEKPWR